MELNGTITPKGGLTGYFEHDITDYNLLTNKPQINGETLIGDKTAHELGIQEEINFPQDPTKYLDGEGNFTTPPTVGNYNDLTNKPQINGETLTGNKTGDDLDLSNKAHVNELSGASVDFQNGQNLPLLKCIANIEPVQSGSGTPSPSNPRPITGWTDTTITVSNDDETETYTAALGQTVYGGTLNLLTGELKITKRIITENDFTMMGGGTSGGGLNYFQIPSTDPQATSGEAISNMLEQNQSGWGSSTPCFSTNTGAVPNIYPVRVYAASSSLANFKTDYNGLQILYELATPIITTITPTKIKSLVGENNISADTGDIDIIYINNVNDPAITFILNNL